MSTQRTPRDVLRDFVYRHTSTRLLLKGVKSLKNDGFRGTLNKVRSRLSQNKKTALPHFSLTLTNKERRLQEKTHFSRKVKFSILVPLYNTPLDYLKQMIASVQAQTYKNWELCLADASDAQHPEVGELCHTLAAKDKRIVYKKLDRNGGISENTNECITMATGDYMSLLDHDDILHPAALYENMKAICEQDADFIYSDEATFEGNPNNVVLAHFKPDFAPDNHRASAYICHFTSFSRALQQEVGGFRKEYDGAQDHDLFLRMTEKARHIVHIPKLLYWWRSHPHSVAQDLQAKPYAVIADMKAVKDSLIRNHIDGEVESSWVYPSMFRIRYKLREKPPISIIIPNKNHYPDLSRCVNSIFAKSTYPDYEIIIVDNNSTDTDILEYYKELSAKNNVKVVHWDHEFNYSSVNNFAVQSASGKYLILLNNDTEVITPDWMEEMLMYAQREDVGAVGAKLYFADNSIQHAGVIVGLGGIAGHVYYHFAKDTPGYMGRLGYAHNLSAVTAACLMVRKEYYLKVGGLDERFAVDYNDVDFCLKLRKLNLLIVFTPFAEMYHYESKSRGHHDTPEKQKRFLGEQELFKKMWGDILEHGDPYYNPNLRLDRGDYAFK